MRKATSCQLESSFQSSNDYPTDAARNGLQFFFGAEPSRTTNEDEDSGPTSTSASG